MSSTHADAVAELITADAVTFASLPLPLAQRIFLALPPDDRGRASCVCRAWRDALAAASLWTCLDMSAVSRADWTSSAPPRFLDVLRGAAGRARCQLRQLDLSQSCVVDVDKLLPVLTANAGSLRELHLQTVYGAFYSSRKAVTCEAVLASAPLLQVRTAEDVTCEWEDAPQMLRADFDEKKLHVRNSLSVNFDGEYGLPGGMECFGPFAAALADATLQPALVRLEVRCADTAQPAVMGALADAALARRLRELTFEYCTPPAAAPLARLLAGGSLTLLNIELSLDDGGDGQQLFDAAGAALVADALCVNTTLTKLTIGCARLSLGCACGWHDTGRARRTS